jgi:hypothetical protein
MASLSRSISYPVDSVEEVRIAVAEQDDELVYSWQRLGWPVAEAGRFRVSILAQIRKS